MMSTLEHTLIRTVVIAAPPDVVFRFFTDSARWAAWWGPGSIVEARPGGRAYVRYPNGIEASGEVLEVHAPDHFTFTFGYVNGDPFPPGASRVTIQLTTVAEGTRLTLTHEFSDVSARDHHVQGWRYQLSVFANVVADEVHANAQHIVDEWFRAWSIEDDGERRGALSAIATPAIRFRDRFGAIDGLDELVPHVGAALRFMPGMTLARRGRVRHCQGTVLADWTAIGADGQPRGGGTNVFVLGPAGQITSVTGLWNA